MWGKEGEKGGQKKIKRDKEGLRAGLKKDNLMVREYLEVKEGSVEPPIEGRTNVAGA